MRLRRRPGLNWNCVLRNCPQLQSPIQRSGDSAHHCESMTLVIGILKAADHGRRRAHAFSQFPLTESSLRSHVAEQLSRFHVHDFLFYVALPPQIVADDLLVGGLERFRSKSFLGFRIHFFKKVCAFGSASNFLLRSIARLISAARTSLSFFNPCATTTTSLPEKKYKIR